MTGKKFTKSCSGVAKRAKGVRFASSVFALAIASLMAFGAACTPADNSYESGIDDNTIVTAPSKPEGSDFIPEDGPVTGATNVVGPVDGETLPSDAFTYEYAGMTEVGFYGKVTQTHVARNLPVDGVHDEGLGSYPVFGTNYGGNKEAVIDESSKLTATGTANAGGGGYTWMDENGYLYSGTRAESAPGTGIRQLYKHTAAVGNYHGNVDDAENRVEKTVTIRPRGYNSYSVTGIYAPAGEVITIKISEADMEATGGLTIHIGQALYNGQANNIWAAKNMPRIPHLLNTMQVNKNTAKYDEATHTYTAYVGSFIGGPLYIRNTNATFTATISGGVEYLHFILGYTTKEEFTRLKQNTSAPYFDMEIWNYGILHSGSRIYAEKYSYEDLYKAAILWEKVTLVTTTRSKQGIVMLYEPFVAAGAAVAFPGRSSVNCPEGWMANSLNYNGLITSGAWGNFHEYHHNFQGFGVGNGGEVTNNSLNLVSYALFTKISSARSIANFGAGTMSGWNRYTSATWALEQTLKIARSGEDPENGNQGLALYATLLHNFGPNNFIQSSVAGGGQSYAGYKQAWEKTVHYNMDYYFNNILKGNTGKSSTASDYPVFVPVSSVYQTGRSFTIDGEKKYFTTMQPYQIMDDEPFEIDLSKYTVSGGQYKSGSIIIPEGFSYRVKTITEPAHGSIEVADNKVIYTPEAGGATSGQIIVTLSITKNDGAFKVADVDLVLEFQPTKELTKNVLERTTYRLEGEGTAYTDATAAYEGNFEGYTKSADKIDHSNPTQNANTDIWYWPNNDANHNQHPNAPEYFFSTQTPTVEVIDGKLYFENDGKYRVFLRGRVDCAVYFSVGGTGYELGAHVTGGWGAGFYVNKPETYLDVQFSNGNVEVTTHIGEEHTYNYTLTSKDGKSYVNWLYVREVLIAQQQGNVVPYIGLGMKAWSETMFTVSEKYFSANGAAVDSAEHADYAYTEATYSDSNGNPVAVQKTPKSGAIEYYKIVSGSRQACNLQEFNELTALKLVAPTSADYVNAYRTSYEFPDNSDYEHPYFYTRSYSYNYTDNYQLGVGQQRVVEDQCANTFLHTGWGGNDLSVVVDGIKDSGNGLQLHMNRRPTAANPFTLVIDLGEVYTANRLLIFSQGGRSDPQFPKALKLSASLDGTNYTLIEEFSDLTFSGNRQTVDFADTQLRYYKLEVTDSHNAYLIIRELEMWHINEVNDGEKLSPDNPNLVFEGTWRAEQTFSTFGHVFVGSANATIKFDFAGTRIGILSSTEFEANFEVYIDDVKVESIPELVQSSGTTITYLGLPVAAGKHKVEIRCTGEANIDSIVIFP